MITKAHKGGGGFTKKSQRITVIRGEGSVQSQTEGGQKGNNFSQGQLSMSRSRCDIFIDK